jgi:hypothetical protein
MKKGLVFVLLLSVICLTSAAFAVEMKRIEEKVPAPVVPGASGTMKIEKVTLDVSCFLDEEPVAAEVVISQIDAGGNRIPDTSESNWSEDGRTRFSVIRGRSYRLSGIKTDHPSVSTFASSPSAQHEIVNIQHSTAVALALRDPMDEKMEMLEDIGRMKR